MARLGACAGGFIQATRPIGTREPVYFDRFRRLLFGETQKRIADTLAALPDAPPADAPNDAYEKTYSELKAYLITTSYHDKSTKEFLTPVLLSHWVADRDIDKDRKDLATSQFDFYSTELTKENPFSSGNSPSLIVHSSDLSQRVRRDRSLLRSVASQGFATRRQFQ